MKNFALIGLIAMLLCGHVQADNYVVCDDGDLTLYCVLPQPPAPAGMPSPPLVVTYVSLPPIHLDQEPVEPYPTDAPIDCVTQYGDAGEAHLLIFPGTGVGQFNVSVDFYPSVACGRIYGFMGVLTIVVMSPPFYAPTVQATIPLIGAWPGGTDNFSMTTPNMTITPGSIVIARMAATGVGQGGAVWVVSPMTSSQVVW